MTNSIVRYAVENAERDASRLAIETGIEHIVKEIDEGVFVAVPVDDANDAIPEPSPYFDETVSEPPKPRSSHNATLDDDRHYCSVDLLKHVDDKHLLKQLSLSVSRATYIPVSTIFLQGLGIFSTVATRCYFVERQNRSELPIGLYVVAEQPPAAAKSWVHSTFQKPFFDVDIEKNKPRNQEIKQLKAIAKKELSDDDKNRLFELLNDPIPTLFTDDTTPEALEKSLIDTSGFFSCASSEQTLFDVLLGLAYGDGKKPNNNGVMLKGYAGEYTKVLRNGREGYAGMVYGGVALFAQEGSVEKVLNASNGTGLSERFLMLAERDNLGKRNHINKQFVDRDLMSEYAKIATPICRKALTKDNAPCLLTISKQGHRLIAEHQQRIEPDLGAGGKYAAHRSLRGAAGKTDMTVMKIAANLHLLDGGAYKSEIADKHVVSAIGIANDLLDAMVALCHDKGLIGAKAEFEAIITYLSNSKRAKGATWREITNSLKSTQPFKNMTSGKNAAIKSAVDEMTAQRLLVVENGVYSIG